MVKTRSGKRPVVIESDAPLKRICLRTSDIRNDGDDDIYRCSICLVPMAFTVDHRPQWSQCTTCKHVFHECCILKYAAREGDTFDCPQCRHTYPSTVFDTEALCADELIDNLIDEQDTEYVEETCKELCSDEEYDSDDEDEYSDDQNSGIEHSDESDEADNYTDDSEDSEDSEDSVDSVDTGNVVDENDQRNGPRTRLRPRV